MSAETPKYVTLARLVRPQGRRGEVAAEILTDFPERLTRLTSVYIWDGKSEPRQIAVRACWLSQSHGGQAIFHFEGFDSINARHTLVCVRRRLNQLARAGAVERQTELFGQDNVPLSHHGRWRLAKVD